MRGAPDAVQGGGHTCMSERSMLSRFSAFMNSSYSMAPSLLVSNSLKACGRGRSGCVTHGRAQGYFPPPPRARRRQEGRPSPTSRMSWQEAKSCSQR